MDKHMANIETQILDEAIVRGRRKMLALGATALAGLAVGGTRTAQAATYSDADILNFALNLEYLEANFYYLSAFGTTIDKPNAASIAAGGPSAGIPITGSVGTAGTVSGGSKVSFATIPVASYAIETAVEEGKHVLFLQSALGSSAVAQPSINLGTSWPMLAAAALIPGASSFSPYSSDANFLLGAYVFEDVGVTAYHGAASLLTSSSNLSAAAGILAVEAYHAGLVRTTINTFDATMGTSLIPITTLISTLRATLAKAAASSTANPYDTNPDDYGLATFSVSLAGASSVTATRLTDADATNVIAFSRTTTQVLNIVTGGGAINATTGAAISPATGVFFPVGLNAGPNGFK
jgi:Ferritin-like domain